MCNIISVSKWTKLEKDKIVYKVVRNRAGRIDSFLSEYSILGRNWQHKLNTRHTGDIICYEIGIKTRLSSVGYFTYLSLQTIKKYSRINSPDRLGTGYCVIRCLVKKGDSVRIAKTEEGYNILLCKRLTPVSIVEL